MKRTLTTAVLAASMIVASLTAALAAQGSDRFRLVPEPSQTETVRVAKSGSTWFTGARADGRPVTVVFLHRFASVDRDGKLIPVSRLRPGDRVEVRGRAAGGRIAAATARLAEPQAAATRTASAQCCAGCATCTQCASRCAECESQAECRSCCGAACCAESATPRR